MTADVQLDLLKCFNPADRRDVSETEMEMKTENILEMKMREICLRPPAVQPFRPHCQTSCRTL
jgi:hypothetical protein